ncbi:MAG TPA: hypothetical protein VF163_21505 [Micromonosporaceae bacterium]
MDVKGILAAAKLAERSVPLCLQPDLVAELQRLERDLADAERVEKASGSLGGGETHVLAERIQALREQMAEHTVELVVRALPRLQWRDLLAAHPPREGNDADKALGVNEDTFFDALVRLCTVSPQLDGDDWGRLEQVLSDGQWSALTNAAWAVNARDVDVPFSPRASRILASSATE